MKMYYSALQNNWAQKKITSQIAVSSTYCSSNRANEYCIWQLVSIRRYLHYLKVNGDGKKINVDAGNNVMAE